MDCIRGRQKLPKGNEEQYELVPQVEQPSVKVPAKPRIYKCITIDPGNDLLRFGPIYNLQDKDPMDALKKKAWRRVKYISLGGDGGIIKEQVVAAIRKVEEEAKKTYDLEIAGPPSEFRMMMIKDGCFFLQLALMILGESRAELPNDLKAEAFFGWSISDKDIRQWMEAMFFVGNQIPRVVLKILIKQKYFQDKIAHGTWDQPTSDLRKRVLYNMVASLDQNAHFRRNDQPGEPSDVLHGLQNMVLGAAPKDDKFGKYEGTSFDLEANEEEAIDDKATNFGSATELKKVGIYIKKLKSGGPRSIQFRRFYFYACLHLPALRVDEDTEIVFSTLRSYEMSNKQLGKHNHEARTYISLMSDLVKTPQDLSLLQKKGIIEGSPDYADKMLGVLRRLSKDVTLTYKFRNIRRQIRHFSSPLVRYQSIINFVVFLTVLQTLFALLAYFKPPKQP